MIIECSYCEVRVFGTVIAEHVTRDPDVPYTSYVQLMECPRCKNTLIGGYDRFYDEDPEDMNEVVRLWPNQEIFSPLDIPEICRVSIVEAKLCYKAKAFSATAVMCGRVLEGICKHHGTTSKNLFAGIKELRENKIIDERIYLWSEQLRRHRNIGAHASEEKVAKEDAKDLLDFVIAICDYVFVLNKKFDAFMSRKKITEDVKNLTD